MHRAGSASVRRDFLVLVSPSERTRAPQLDVRRNDVAGFGVHVLPAVMQPIRRSLGQHAVSLVGGQ